MVLHEGLTIESSKLPVLDPFSDICPLMVVALHIEALSLASLFLEELDSFRGITYESEAEESGWEVENDSDRELEGDSENNSDNILQYLLYHIQSFKKPYTKIIIS